MPKSQALITEINARFFTILAHFCAIFLKPVSINSALSPASLRKVSLMVILLFFSAVGYAQNTKGDQPGKPLRESRFKSKPAKSQSNGSGKRIGSKGKSQAASATRKGEKAGKPIRPIYKSKSTSGNDRPHVGDISGRKIPATRSQTKQSRNVYPQSGRYMGQRGPSEKDPQKRWSAVKTQRIQVRSATGKTKNVYPQFNRYVNNPSRRPQSVERPTSNAPQLARLKKMQSQPQPPSRKRVVPVTASKSYIARKSINPYAGFWSQKPRKEKPYLKDITGRRLRTKNYETPRPGVIKPTTTPYYGRKRIGDKPYRGPSGGYKSTTSTKPKAWQGDISGRKIRGRNFTSKGKVQAGQPVSRLPKVRDRYGDRPYKGAIPGGGAKSATQSAEKRTGKSPLPAKVPGKGADQMGLYQGNIRYKKAFSDQGTDYSGFMKAKKPVKGGGSVSGKLWNNQNRPIIVKTYPSQGADFSGSMKAIKPVKGGGSVSGKLWNNNEQPITGRAPKGSIQMGRYQGNIKASKKDAGKEQSEFPGRIRKFDLYPSMRDQGEAYTGHLKASKPKKGGGSVSGKLWNNNEQPITGKAPKGAEQTGRYQGNIKVSKKEPDKEIAGFPGKYRKFDLYPSMRDQGEAFTGTKRLSRFRKDYVRNKNTSEDALLKARPDKTAYKVDGLHVRVKEKDYKKKPNAAENALLGIAPDKNFQKSGEYAGRMKQPDYKRKPHAAENALLGIGPTKTSIKASEYARGIKLEWQYKHNPSSAEEALKVREPGKAFVRSTDYQGNIKMKKYELFAKKNLHPDAQFMKTNKNNVKEEKDALTNFKLWWARLFKKSDTQPDHLKEKIRKPRYDKGEIGLWYD